MLEIFEAELCELLPDYYVDDGLIDKERCIIIRQRGSGSSRDPSKATVAYLDEDVLTVILPHRHTSQEELDCDDIGIKSEMLALADKEYIEYTIADPKFDIEEVAADIHRVMKHL